VNKIYQQLKNKKIGILGFGVEGKATFNYLRKFDSKLMIFDQAQEEEFLARNPEIKKEEVALYLGRSYLENLNRAEIIFKSPGIPLLLPEIQAAIKEGIIFTSQIEFFFDCCPAKIIGVTGTKGKGTTATLIYEILKASDKDVYLGGNIGLPTISFLDKLNERSVVVLELSSFQLQSLKESPHIAVVLNVTKDHLDYHSSAREYQEAKKSIVRYQTKDNFAVINADYSISKGFARETKGQKYFFSRKTRTNGCYVDGKDNIILETTQGIVQIIAAKDLLLRGRHNLENVTAAVLASYLAKVSIKVITETVKNFHGLEHRLELVREISRVRYFNDSFSTVPETAIAAVKSFTEPIVLILGGSYKGSDYRKLGKTIENSGVKSIIFIGETAKEISRKIGSGYEGERIFGLTKMTEIVKKASSLAKPEDVVLLSPACASFGLFQNYKDRGGQFKKAVEKL
jgi:UDP-N-acetylmuramoylalanine--D-glutamate ligase